MNKEQQRKQKFKDFLDWFKKNIKGDEKKEDKLFFNELLKAFGNSDLLSAGAKTEVTLKNKSGATGFADFLWGDRVLIELKKRKTPLAKHYQQAADYWMMTTPKPKYMVLCNFDEFWIYDFNIQMNDPVHKLEIKNLESEYAALAFLFPIPERPFFNNNFVEVTENSAKILGEIYYSLKERKIDPFDAQRFVLQLVVALFSEDVGLIPKNIVRTILKDTVDNHNSGKAIDQKELMDLFTAMATQQKSKIDGKYSNIPYFNGGIFNTVKSFKLMFNEIDQLYKASLQDWSKVRPSIFGSIFESSIDQNLRHDKGIHYTSELDIQKIVGPTIVRPFRRKIEKSKTKQQRLKILEEVRNFKVLDPACGSGNFLYIAFRELRRLEFELLEQTEKNFDPKKFKSYLVSPKNFYGIDTSKFGIELAKLALGIGRKLSADELGISDKVLPFENLDDNFLDQDALFIQWPEAHAIIGNPPFLGGSKILTTYGKLYTDQLYKKFNEVKGQADYCSYWFRLAHSSKANYCGLVGTNSISQGISRDASLNFIMENNGTIHDAVSTQKWSGQANVHVSLVNWTKEQWKNKLFLDGKEVDFINSSLKNEFDVTTAPKLKQNETMAFEGVSPKAKGFLVAKQQANEWFKVDKKNSNILKPYLSVADLTDSPLGVPERWTIDFDEMNIENASIYSDVFKYAKKTIYPQRAKLVGHTSVNVKRKENWWQMGSNAKSMRAAISKIKFFFCFPRHSKWVIPLKCSSNFLPNDSTTTIASEDFYILGILTSKLHRDWVKAQSSSLEDRTRYTNTTCFETFPFLWDVPKKLKDPVRNVMKKLDAYRMKTMRTKKYGITKLYNDFFNEPASELYKLHAELDKVAAKVYGWKKFDPKKNYNEELYKLNLKLHKQEQDEEVKRSRESKRSSKKVSAKSPKLRSKK